MTSRKSLAWAFLITLAVVAPSMPGEAAEQQAPPPKAAPGPSAAAIPLAEVAMRAAEVSALVPTYEALGAPTAQIATIQQQLPEVSLRIGRELQGLLSILREQPTLQGLEEQQRYWVGWHLRTSSWLSAVTQQAKRLQEAMTRLTDLRQVWNQTQASAREAQAPEPILQQIAGLLATIEMAQIPLHAQRATVFDLQSRVGQEVARCQTALAQIADAQRQAVVGLRRRDGLPLWSPDLWERARTEGPGRIRAIAAVRWSVILHYVLDPSEGLAYDVAIFVVLAGLLWAARRWVGRGGAASEGASSATAVFDRPFSAALLLTLFVASGIFSAAPPIVRSLFQVLALVPAIRLMPPVLGPRPGTSLYALGILYILSVVRQGFAGVLVLEPAMLALEMLGGVAALAYALTLGNLRHPSALAITSERLRALRVVAGLVLLLAAAALGATVLGYLRLARLLASGLLASAYLALILGAVVRIVTGLIALLFHMWPVRRLQMVAHHRDLLERRARRVLILLAIGLWLVRTLDQVGLLGPVLALGQAVLTARLQRGAISISLGDLLDFALTLGVAFLVSMFLRFALQEDVYPRVGLTRGASYAFSSLLNYLIVTLGFLLGLAALGMDLTKVTILAGALGVGIGFGLQDVVNNFVSGLILLFERPIHVGDSVEVGNLAGTVSRIGIRASTLRTGQGAELIVPNAKLVTEQMTNWTLSDRLRRIDLPVGVNYGSPPQKVIEVLEAVARAHPDVLRQPAPQAFFTGFGDSSINFELRAWTEHSDRWFQVKSQLGVAVHDAVLAAGMSFPFPQREIRLLRESPDDPA